MFCPVDFLQCPQGGAITKLQGRQLNETGLNQTKLMLVRGYEPETRHPKLVMSDIKFYLFFFKLIDTPRLSNS